MNTSDLATNGNQPTPTHLEGTNAANLEAEGPHHGPAPPADAAHIGGPANGTGGPPGANGAGPSLAVQGADAARGTGGGPSPSGPREAALIAAVAAASGAEDAPRLREAAAATPRSGLGLLTGALDLADDEKGAPAVMLGDGEEPPRAASVLQTSATPIPNPVEAAQQAAALAAAVSLPNGESFARLAGGPPIARMSGSMGGAPLPAAPTPPPPALPHHLLGVNGSASMGAPSPVMGGLVINSGLMTGALGRGAFGGGPVRHPVQLDVPSSSVHSLL